MDQSTLDQAREWVGEHYPHLDGEPHRAKVQEVARELQEQADFQEQIEISYQIFEEILWEESLR